MGNYLYEVSQTPLYTAQNEKTFDIAQLKVCEINI